MADQPDEVVPASLISADEADNPQPETAVPIEAIEAARAAYDSVVIAHGAYGYRRGHHDAIVAAVTAVVRVLEQERPHATT